MSSWERAKLDIGSVKIIILGELRPYIGTLSLDDIFQIKFKVFYSIHWKVETIDMPNGPKICHNVCLLYTSDAADE